MDLEIYQKLCAESKILWTQHCLQRMQERGDGYVYVLQK